MSLLSLFILCFKTYFIDATSLCSKSCDHLIGYWLTNERHCSHMAIWKASGSCWAWKDAQKLTFFSLFQFANSSHWPFLVFLHIHVFYNAELNEAYLALLSVSCCHDLAGPPSFHVIFIGCKKASSVSLVTSL